MEKEVKEETVETSPAEVTTEPVSSNTSVDNKAIPSTPKVKKIGIVPIIAVAVVVIIVAGLVGTRAILTSPKNVYKSAINNLYKQVNNSIEEFEATKEKYNIEDGAVYFSGDVKIDTSIEELTEEFDLSAYTFSAGVGLDIQNEQLNMDLSVKGSSEEINANVYYIDDVFYLTSNLFDDVLKTETDEYIDFSEIEPVIDSVKTGINYDTQVFLDISESIKNALIESLDNEYMEKESDEVSVSGEDIKVTKYSYILDEDAIQDLVKTISEYLLDDSDFISNLSDITGTDKSEIKDLLKEIKSSAKDITFDDKITINIYSKGLFYTFAGLDIEYNKDTYFSIYTDGDNYEITVDNNVDTEYGQEKIVCTIKENKDEYDLTVKYNGEKIVTGTIREMSDTLVDFDFEVEYEGEKISGSYYVSKKESKTSLEGDYKVKVTYNDEYVEVSGNYGITSKDSLETVDTKNAIDLDDLDESELENNLSEIILKDSAFQNAYENIVLEDADYYRMTEITSTGGIKLAMNEKWKNGSVIYVGDYNYYYYNNNLLRYLMSAQSELEFESYYINKSTITTEMKALLDETNSICTINTESDTDTEQTCEEYPAIYLIKDGKVKKVVRGNITIEELYSYLKEIGIE